MNQDYTKLLGSILKNMALMDHIRPSEIPNIDLYMDQVTSFMNDHLQNSRRFEDDKILTKTMINNYAKNKLLPPPIKKRYSKEHLFVLVFIYYMKGFFSLSDIQTMRSKQPYYSVKELIEDVLEQTEYRKELMSEGTEEALDRLANIDELLNKAASYAEHADNPSLGGFLEEVALVADIDNLEEDADHVVMMTLHSAKGLEFPVVFMVGMEDGMFPSYMSISSEDPADLEEERRLCYVGITRAKETLILTSARQRMVRGEIHYNRVSRFIEDIPKEVLAENETANVQPKEKKERPETKAHAAYRQMRETFKTKAFVQPQVEAKKEGGLSYNVGDRVRHIKFGVGSVTDIREGGRDYEVTVNFDRVGVKKMFASFAKLTKVEG